MKQLLSASGFFFEKKGCEIIHVPDCEVGLKIDLRSAGCGSSDINPDIHESKY
jgi:hypothetical protein